jgi:two-component system phosphate regulon sensor histidine kinase PhoR
MNIHTKLILNYMGIVLVILLAMYGYLDYSLKQNLSERITDELTVQANLTREFLLEKLPDTYSYEIVDDFVDRLGTASASRARLTFIGRDGIVWGDTERDGQHLRDMDNHRDRPEVQAALAGRIGTIDRYSDTVMTTLRYLALPVVRDGEMIGICRVALPMMEIDTAISQLRWLLLLAISAGLVFAILFSIITTNVTTKPIRDLTQATKSLAIGELNSRVSVAASGELGELSNHFNQMANRIETQIHEISRERNLRDSILSKMVEGVLFIDAQFAITYANSAAITMLDFPVHYQALSLVEIVPDPALKRLLRQVTDTGKAEFAEITLVGPTERETEVIVVPVGGEYLVSLHDVSQLRKLERIRSDFVANVAHEMRVPLTSIHGYAETLLNGALEDTDANERFVEKILQQSARLSQLVSDLLDLSHLESGEVQLKLKPCEISEFQGTILTLFEPVFEEADLTFEWSVPNHLPVVFADKQLIGQVLANLIENAIKYTPAGGVIMISGEANDSEVIVHVKDTGIGIPAEAVSRIFERFYRVDKGRSREMGGTGLGLAIAKHILLQHGGRIWVDSSPGEGSVFHFALPLQRRVSATEQIVQHSQIDDDHSFESLKNL